MNENKICFISCVNDHQLYKESLYYINQLEIPEGYEIECICVEDAISMTQGYNKAMKESDAKYKVYLHQDIYIINKSFIRDVLDVFNSNDEIGMLGMAGAKTIPTNGVWWESTHKYGEVYESHTGKMELLQFNKVTNNYEEVKAIDGLIIITQYDIPWREDIFDGWHFYDVSQSVEFTSKGYRVVIPEQEEVWCIHDCGILNIKNGYEHYRNVFLEEYSKFIYPLVSILIPTYNRPKYLQLALESVLNQTYRNIEIIIGDDSTNKETERLIKENYLNEYDNIRYYHNEKNLGQFDNDIKLYNMANGQYINYLMDDDLFQATKIQKMMNYFVQDENEEISLVTSHRGIIDENGNYNGIFGNTEKIFENDTIVSGIEMGNQLIISHYNFLGEPTTVLFRKKYLLEPFGVFNGRKYGPNVDQASWLNLLSEGNVVYINEVLSYFRIHEGQQQHEENLIFQGQIDHVHKLLTCRNKNFMKKDEDYIKAIDTLIWHLNLYLDHIKDSNDNLKRITIEKSYNKLKSIKDEMQRLYEANKKYSILITNNHLVNFAGSEIVTLNLAKNFKMLGFKVFVGTFKYGYPIKELFEKNNINVNSLLDTSLDNMKFDFIWGQHFTTIYSALFNKKISANKIIVNSMSPFEPLESPPIFSNYLSLNVVNSEETKDKIISEGVDKSSIYVMPNPVENDFAFKYRKRKKNLNKVCVVSNHVPKEIYEAMKLLSEKGIECDIFGINDNVVYITPELLDSYDALITIGKTVQYGLIMGIPVYCYDRFGGPGWIRTFNFDSAYNYNFSGRCKNKRISSQDIVTDIISGYEGAFGEREVFHEFALKNFIMEDHLKSILEIVNGKESVDIKQIKQIYGMIERHNSLYLSNLK